MPTSVKRVSVAIASPNDVISERNRVPSVFVQWSSANRDVSLHPEMWETGTTPSLGDHPQNIINKDIIQRSDLLVAIFWYRLGTPTPTAPSGTIQEIREFIEAKGPARVMLYFCTRRLPYDLDLAEFGRLQEFKAQMQKEGLYQEYEGVEDFEKKLYVHLDVKVKQLMAGELEMPQQTQTPTPSEMEWKTSVGDPPIDFGTSLDEISRRVWERQLQFDAIPGALPTKYCDLGGHFYGSVAVALDRYLKDFASDMSEESQSALERISIRFKTHANAARSQRKRPFNAYWDEGRAICSDLRETVEHIKNFRQKTG